MCGVPKTKQHILLIGREFGILLTKERALLIKERALLIKERALLIKERALLMVVVKKDATFPKMTTFLPFSFWVTEKGRKKERFDGVVISKPKGKGKGSFHLKLQKLKE